MDVADRPPLGPRYIDYRIGLDVMTNFPAQDPELIEGVSLSLRLVSFSCRSVAEFFFLLMTFFVGHQVSVSPAQFSPGRSLKDLRSLGKFLAGFIHWRLAQFPCLE